MICIPYRTSSLSTGREIELSQISIKISIESRVDSSQSSTKRLRGSSGPLPEPVMAVVFGLVCWMVSTRSDWTSWAVMWVILGEEDCGGSFVMRMAPKLNMGCLEIGPHCSIEGIKLEIGFEETEGLAYRLSTRWLLLRDNLWSPSTRSGTG